MNRTPAPPFDPEANLLADPAWCRRCVVEQEMAVVYESEIEAFHEGKLYRERHGTMDRGAMVLLSTRVQPETIERLAWQRGWCWADTRVMPG